MAPLKMLKISWIFSSLSGDWTQGSSFSPNIASSFTGCSKYCASESILFDKQSINLMLWMNPSLPLFVAMIFAMGNLFLSASSFSSTISPTKQLHFGEFHFCLPWSVINASFLHQSKIHWKCAALFYSAYESKYQVLKILLEVASPPLISLLTS